MNHLRLHNVTRKFGGVSAVNSVSLEFTPGKVSALIGPNGAGKTTIFNLIGGQLDPSAGNIYYDEKEISRRAPWRLAQLGIGRLFQDVRIFDRLSVKENVLVAFTNQLGENPVKSLFTRWKVNTQEAALKRRVSELLEPVGLARYANQLAGNLSFGEQKLLGLVRLIAADFDVLLLDEPTAGVSPSMAEKIFRLIRRVADEGKTVVIIEHNMNIISEWVDVVYFMDRGHVVLSGKADDVLGQLRVKMAYLGLSN